MAKLLLLVILLAVCAVGYAKHVHPKHIMDMEEDAANDSKPITTEFDGLPIEVISHIKPSRFVPINNVLFFMRYPPCEEGFERDVLGVCREVWE